MHWIEIKYVLKPKLLSMLKTPLLIIVILIIVAIILNQVLFGKVSTLIHEGQFKHRKVMVKEILHKNLVQHRLTQTIKLGNLPTIEVDAFSTDICGVPYDDAIYHDAKRLYFDTLKHYKNEGKEGIDVVSSTMLYLNPKKFSETDFNEYADFFKTEWLNINNQSPKKMLFNKHLVGIVYGNSDDFKQVFKGNHDGEIYCLEIKPDGVVSFHEEKGALGFTSSGLSVKVKMPERILYNVGHKPLDFYRNFKDNNGKTLEDFFTILDKAAK
jgi:hypothetical protein